nr:MAG TPA: hypothetical protein [Caudoviricetes sp.]
METRKTHFIHRKALTVREFWLLPKKPMTLKKLKLVIMFWALT